MNDLSAVNINTQLKGMVVIEANTAEERGHVIDLVIKPDSGAVMAMIFRSSHGDERAVAPDDFFIHKEANAAFIFGEPVTDKTELRKMVEKGMLARGELVASEVVTRDGRLLGRVSDVFLQPDSMEAIYHITSSPWQRLFGGGFYLAGNAPCAYSRAGARLIAPADARRYLFRSLAESVKALIKKTAAA